MPLCMQLSLPVPVDIQTIIMKKIVLLFCFALTPWLLLFSQVSDREIFINPMSFTPALSASFSELRADHFHSGLDFKTGGVTGKEVKAAADGYIYRISVSPFGFGKAIYIRHSNGYSTVYGHLDRFRKDIQEYVVSKQYEQQDFSITLYPARDQFQVKQGELIAWSGNTGGSAGPHLHFEVRESSSENPVNPLLFDLNVTDTQKPTIDKIVIYPITRNSSVNSSHTPLSLKASGVNGRYSVTSTSPVVINGLIGFGIKTWDTFNNSVNKCGVYRICVDVDSTRIYNFTCDQFSFSESRYINSHIDYFKRIENNEYLHKTWLEPGNKLSMYSSVLNRGLTVFNDNREHHISIIVSDTYGNTSTVKFSVRSVEKPPVKEEEESYDQVIPFGKSAEFSAEGIRVHFPSTALYDTLFFKYGYRSRERGLLSGVHSVHRASTAINDPIRISIKPDSIPDGCEEKLCMVKITNSNTQIYTGGEMRFGYLSAEVRSFGDYAVSIDTIPPVIKPSFAKGANLSGRNNISVTIKDNLSGIRSYDAYIDGQWALFEYDAKINMITWHASAGKLKSGINHQIEIRVVDNKNNSSTLKSSFFW